MCPSSPMEAEPAAPTETNEMFEWAFFARNTFVDVHDAPPPELELQRAASEPVNGSLCHRIEFGKERRDSEFGDTVDYPPPPLQLECVETYDPFEGQQVLNHSTMPCMLEPERTYEETSEQSTASPGAESDASGSEIEGLMPPSPLDLECLETYDPFEYCQQPKPTVESHEEQDTLHTPHEHAPENNVGEARAPEAEWTVFAKNTFLDIQAPEPPLLDLCRASTEPTGATMFLLGETEPHDEQYSASIMEPCDEQKKAADVDEISAAAALDGDMPPPLLELESFETEDMFNKPQMFAEQAHMSKVDVVELEPAIATRLGGPPPPPSTPMPVMPTPPPPPPSMPAPTMEAPCSPEAPVAPPSSGPKEDTSRPSAEQMANCGMLWCIPAEKGPTHVHWAIDSRKLDSQHKQIVSPGFSIDLPGQGQQPFKMVVYPKTINEGKHGAGFRKAKGVGRVMIKCEAQLEEKRSDLVFRIGIGRDSKLQPPRGPVTRDFFEQSCHGLAKTKEEWDFTLGVDDSDTFLISLQIAPLSAVIRNPHLWWPAEAERSTA